MDDKKTSVPTTAEKPKPDESVARTPKATAKKAAKPKAKSKPGKPALKPDEMAGDVLKKDVHPAVKGVTSSGHGTTEVPAETPAPKDAKPGKPKGEEPGGPDFKSLTTVEECLDTYNEMVLTAVDLKIPKVTSVRSFRDVKTGVLACERLHALINKTREPQQEKTMAKKAKKTSSRTAVKGKTKTAGSGAKRTRLDETAKVTWLGKDIPHREGTGKYDRTVKVKSANGQTVGSVLKKVSSGTLRRCIKEGLVKVA